MQRIEESMQTLAASDARKRCPQSMIQQLEKQLPLLPPEHC